MFRGTTARTLVRILAAVLLALPFFTLAPSFAPAHSSRHVEATAEPGIKPKGKTLRDERVTSGNCAHSGGTTSPARTRDRFRGTADSTSQAPERPLRAEDPAPDRRQAVPGVAYQGESRSSTAHTPAALQVFRC
ncbi:hypothetical protein [Streptomyces griseus]|uniref:hypothetical protein n=1 Tax=Streptomyces griseus TaxID=1911 RepID=UPI00056CA197|nr:hypothetical protein [Streptomyces griseus]